MGSLPRQGASLEEVSVKMGTGGMLQEQWEHGEKYERKGEGTVELAGRE